MIFSFPAAKKKIMFQSKRVRSTYDELFWDKSAVFWIAKEMLAVMGILILM